jgi:hypothetical protein
VRFAVKFALAILRGGFDTEVVLLRTTLPIEARYRKAHRYLPKSYIIRKHMTWRHRICKQNHYYYNRSKDIAKIIFKIAFFCDFPMSFHVNGIEWLQFGIDGSIDNSIDYKLVYFVFNGPKELKSYGFRKTVDLYF